MTTVMSGHETPVVRRSRDELLEFLRRELPASMSVDRFTELGARGELREENLRDLWLIVGPVLSDG